jgi:hypothetical protein
MLDRLLGRVHDTKHGAPVLRGYLWWGLVLRGVLLVALGVLLLVEGNVLAEWLLTARVPFVSAEGVKELTTISYTVIFMLLTIGVGVRWRLLHRLDVLEQTTIPGPPSSSEAATSPDD